MEYEEDFVTEESIEFEVDGRKFKYKPTTAGDENRWLEEYIETGEDGKPHQNLEKLNQCKIRNILSVPYSEELIEKIVGVKKTWEELSESKRWELISKLKPSTFNGIIGAINDIDSPKKKQSQN